jgi:hypothetical protein
MSLLLIELQWKKGQHKTHDWKIPKIVSSSFFDEKSGIKTVKISSIGIRFLCMSSKDAI